MSDDVETTVPGGRLIDPNEGDRGVSDDTALPYLRPRDSATLILIDRSEPVPKVLLGRRHSRHKFVPGKFVFPGGRVEVSDRQMPFAAPLHERHTARLLYKLKRPSAAKAAAYALAAVRETYEETGLMLGTRAAEPIAAPAGPWQAFAQARHPARPRRHPFRRPRHHADEPAAALRQPLLRRRRLRHRPPGRRLCRARRRTCGAGLAADHRGEPPRHAAHHHDRARRPARPHRAGMSHDHPVPFYRMLHRRFGARTPLMRHGAAFLTFEARRLGCRQ